MTKPRVATVQQAENYRAIVDDFDTADAIKVARNIWDDFSHYDIEKRWGMTLWAVAVFTLGPALRRHNLSIVRRTRKVAP